MAAIVLYLNTDWLLTVRTIVASVVLANLVPSRKGLTSFSHSHASLQGVWKARCRDDWPRPNPAGLSLTHTSCKPNRASQGWGPAVLDRILHLRRLAGGEQGHVEGARLG